MSTLNQSRNGPATVQLREAHPGPAHARVGVSEPARESPYRIGPRRPLVVVAVAVVMSLVVFAVWRLFLAPSAVAPDVIAVSGRIEGDDSAVATKTSGRIRAITVREGDGVEAGEVLAVLDADEVRAGEDQATAAVRQAEARARLAQHQIAVLDEQLRQSRLGVDQARGDAEGRVNEAEGRLAAAEAQLAQAQAAHAQAKWDREAMARLFQKGLVAEQEAQRARNNEEAPAAFVPEGQIGRVSVGQPARIYLDSAPAKPIDAYVLRVDPQASFTPENTYFREDRVKQVVGVKLRLKGALGFAKPGMPADGEILVDGNDWPTRQAHR